MRVRKPSIPPKLDPTASPHPKTRASMCTAPLNIIKINYVMNSIDKYDQEKTPQSWNGIKSPTKITTKK